MTILECRFQQGGRITEQVPSCQRVQRRAWHFPGDPRYGFDIIPPANDVACLTKSFLSTAVLDCIIQHTAKVLDSSMDSVPVLLGSLGAEAFTSSMEQMKRCPDRKLYQNHIHKVCAKFKNFLNHNIWDGDDVQRLVIPMVSPPDQIGHFFVTCFDFSVNDQNSSCMCVSTTLWRAANNFDVLPTIPSFWEMLKSSVCNQTRSMVAYISKNVPIFYLTGPH